jgi:hypothetical protein
MPDIDIAVSSDLKEMFALPACTDIGLPPPSKLTVQLPGGATLSALTDLSKGIPSDCALTFSLLLQIAPFLAATECVVKVLKLVQTVVDTLKSISSPFDLVGAIPKIIEAAEPVIACALSFTPAGLIPFIRDLLCLIIKVLKCFLSQLKSVTKILGGLAVQIQLAQASGNNELLASLNCAQQNALTQAQYMTQSLEALSIILDLAGDLMQIVGIAPIKIPSLASQADLAALNQFEQSIQEVVATLQTAVDLLGGCQ